MDVSEVTQNRPVVVCGRELWRSVCRGWVLGAKLKAFLLGSVWLKSKSNWPLKNLEAEVWSKTIIPAPNRGSDTWFDTKGPFHLLYKLCTCWCQVLIKRVKKKVAWTLSEWREQPPELQAHRHLCLTIGWWELTLLQVQPGAADGGEHSPCHPPSCRGSLSPWAWWGMSALSRHCFPKQRAGFLAVALKCFLLTEVRQ